MSGVTLAFDEWVTAAWVINAKYYYVKALPEITVQDATVADQITLRISLPVDAENAITLTQLNWTWVLSVNNQDESFGAALTNPITVTPGRYVDVVVEATSTITTANLTSVLYATSIDGTAYTYTIDKTYTNFPWATFKAKWTH